MRRALLLMEFNEFSPELLAAAARDMRLKHIEKLLALRHSTTTTEDEVEGHGLDPWVQWVSVHCGKPASVHGIKRLGSTREQSLPQLWHEAAKLGHGWGVWGVMNAPLGDATGCRFFVPDPWSFEEAAYPPKLNDLLALPRYMSKNYFDAGAAPVLAGLFRLARFYARPAHWGIALRMVAKTLKVAITNGLTLHSFTTLYDYLSVLHFIQLRRKTGASFSIVFLNHIAHLQHNCWQGTQHPEMKLGLILCDEMLGLLFADRRPDEALVVMNAFRQHNVAGQGYFIYHPRNPQAMAEALGIGGVVEQNMTHDANAIFDTPEAAERAFALLKDYRFEDGRALFYVERKSELRLFFQLAFTDYEVPDGAIIHGGERRFAFHDHFKLICERTGAHVREGDVYYDGIDLPSHCHNHELYAHMLAYLGGTIPIEN